MYKFIYKNELGQHVYIKKETRPEADGEIKQMKQTGQIHGVYQCIGMEEINPVVEHDIF